MRKSLFVLACPLMWFAAGDWQVLHAQPVPWPEEDGGNGHLYEVVSVPERISWTAARDAAIAAGGYLATVTSAEENQFILDLAVSGPYWDYGIGPWLGGYQPEWAEEPDQDWQWVTGEPFEFSAWLEGEPNDAGDEDLLIFMNFSGWNDWSETAPDRPWPIAYIVEWETTIQPILIDIKPGSSTNCFKIDGNGVIPVAILGGIDLDTREVDPNSLVFDGLVVGVRADRGPACGERDINGDGFADLVCRFVDDPDYWTGAIDVGTVRGELYDGTIVEGTDVICLVP